MEWGIAWHGAGPGDVELFYSEGAGCYPVPGPRRYYTGPGSHPVAPFHQPPALGLLLLFIAFLNFLNLMQVDLLVGL